MRNDQGDPRLLAEGWKRRHVADEARARESADLYQAMGLEVRFEKLSPDGFEAKCGECAEATCSTYVLIYTREKDR